MELMFRDEYPDLSQILVELSLKIKCGGLLTSYSEGKQIEV